MNKSWKITAGTAGITLLGAIGVVTLFVFDELESFSTKEPALHFSMLAIAMLYCSCTTGRPSTLFWAFLS